MIHQLICISKLFQAKVSELWYVEEYDVLALALNGKMEVRMLHLGCNEGQDNWWQQGEHHKGISAQCIVSMSYAMLGSASVINIYSIKPLSTSSVKIKRVILGPAGDKKRRPNAPVGN